MGTNGGLEASRKSNIAGQLSKLTPEKDLNFKVSSSVKLNFQQS